MATAELNEQELRQGDREAVGRQERWRDEVVLPQQPWRLGEVEARGVPDAVGRGDDFAWRALQVRGHRGELRWQAGGGLVARCVVVLRVGHNLAGVTIDELALARGD